MGKRGISTIIATVLVLLITIAAVSIIWVFILPIVKESSSFSERADLTIARSEGWTLYDSQKNTACIQIKRGADNSDLSRVKILFYSQGNSNFFIVPYCGEEWDKNIGKVFCFNLTGLPSPEEVAIVPIYSSGKEGVILQRTSLLSQDITSLSGVNIISQSEMNVPLQQLSLFCNNTNNSKSSNCTYTNNGWEICDGIDNDCDGLIDENLSCNNQSNSTVCKYYSSPVCNHNGICEGLENNQNCHDDCPGQQISPELKTIIDAVWSYNMPVFINQIDSYLQQGNSQALYNVEGYTINLLKYAQITKDYKKIDELARVYLTAYPYLNYLNDTDKRVYKVWTNSKCTFGITNNCTIANVDMLNIVQFAYSLASELNAITDVPVANRTATMIDFVNKYSNVTRDFLTYLELKRGRNCQYYWAPYLGSSSDPNKIAPIRDHDFLVLGSAEELLMANSKEPSLIPINSTEKDYLLGEINCSYFYFKKRLTNSSLTDFNGNPVKGILLDSGLYCIPHYAYPNGEYWDMFSNYTSEIFPTDSNQSCAYTASWDISHGRRIPLFLETLYKAKSVINQTFPDEEFMKQWANQFVYGISNKNLSYPLFKNFIDGSNGWVGVNTTTGRGYGMYGMSKTFPQGGYGFFSKYNPDLYTILAPVWEMYKNPGKDNQTFLILQKYYVPNPQYYNFNITLYSLSSINQSLDKTNSIELLYFLPSLVSENSCENNTT